MAETVKEKLQALISKNVPFSPKLWIYYYRALIYYYRAKTRRLWHHDYNETSQNNIVDHEDLQALLMDNIQMLAKNVELSDDFWNLLLTGGVLPQGAMDYIKARKTKQVQSLALLYYLLERKVYQMHAFFWALVNSGQYALVKQLNLSINDYLDVDIFMKSSIFRCPCCHEAYTIAYLLTGCGHYVCRPCVKASKFNKTVDEKEEITCPIADCGQITVASPSEENIGEDEDETFTDLCQIVDSTQAGDELPIQENGALEQAMKVKAEIAAKMTRLENHKDDLTKQRKTIEKWFHTNMDKYTSVHTQLVRVIQQSSHWMKVVDDLSVLLTARPELKNGMKLPQLSLSSDSIKLMNEIMSGCSVEELKTQLENLPVQFHPTPSFKTVSLQCKWKHSSSCIYDLFWTLNGHLMVLIDQSLWELTLDNTVVRISSAVKVYTSDCNITRPGFWMGNDGTWTCCKVAKGIVEIHKLGELEVKQWRPTHVCVPYQAVVGTDSIYVLDVQSHFLREYNRNLDFIGQHQLGATRRNLLSYLPEMYMCVTGNLLIYDYNILELYIVSPLMKMIKCQFSHCDLRPPIHVCEGPGHSILVIFSNGRLCVFTSDGQFLYHININEDIGTLRSASVLTRSGHPALLAITCKYDKTDEIRIYSLE